MLSGLHIYRQCRQDITLRWFDSSSSVTVCPVALLVKISRMRRVRLDSAWFDLTRFRGSRSRSESDRGESGSIDLPFHLSNRRKPASVDSGFRQRE